MIDRNITAEKVIKALLCCANKMFYCKDKECMAKTLGNAIDFIYSQKAELDGLKRGTIPDSGALIPPVKIGQTVYAVLIYDPEDELNEDFIEEYTVGGVGYIDGEWYVYDKRDRELYKVGTDECKLTREEAEAAIAAARSAADIKDGHKNGGAE